MMSKKKALAYKVVTVVMTALLTLNTSPFTMLASRAVAAETQQAISSDTGSEETTLNTAVDGVSDGDSTETSKQDGDMTPTEGSTSSQVSGEEPVEGEENSNESALSLEGNGETLALSDSNDGEQSSVTDTSRASENFEGDSYVSKLTLSLTSGEVSKTYETTGSGTIDTTTDFPDGLSRSATYTANITINTQAMLEAQGKYPFVAGDTVTCKVPDLIRTGDGVTSGRLRDSTANWDGNNDGVGSYTVSKDKDGHNILTITYDDGYITEKNGKILSSSVKLSGGFDTSSETTEWFNKDLIFGGLTVKTKFSKLEIIRNLSIEKTGDVDEDGAYVGWQSQPSTVRKGTASIDADGYLTYSITVKAGQDNTYKLANVKVTDLFDTASQAKVDLSTVTLLNVVNDGEDTTKSAQPIYDGGNISGWNIGDLGIGCSATIQFKVKINKDGITAAVDAAKQVDASTDAADARTIRNIATVEADDTSSVSDDYSTKVENYIKVSKSTKSFDQKTQRQYFEIRVTSPADNRYTMHDVPIHDYLGSGLDASCYAGSGISSMSVRHSDGTTESLSWTDLKQINSSGTADTRSWYAKISEIRPGDVVTITAYLEVNQNFWNHKVDDYSVGDYSRSNCVYVGSFNENGYCASDLNRYYDWSNFELRKYLVYKSGGSIDTTNGTIEWTIRGNTAGLTPEATDVSGSPITDKLGPNLAFMGEPANVTFFNQDGSKAGTDSFELPEGTTEFAYNVPEKYGTCGYEIKYKTKITDWDSYVGPAKRYYNEVNGYKASSYQRSRVAAMNKQFVQQADNWSQWKTEIFSELQDGDTYLDTSNPGIDWMYFTDEDLAGISLTIDGVALDSSLYLIESVKSGSSDGKYKSYLITFKGDVLVTKDGQKLKPSKDHPLVVSYKAHMVNPSISYGQKSYRNDATLTAGNVIDTDYDYCRRNNSKELVKSVNASSNGSITWDINVNSNGYAGQPDGTCVVKDTLPAGLTYKSIAKLSGVGAVDSVDSTTKEDGTTELTIRVSGLYHDEACLAHENDYNSSDNNTLKLQLKTQITDPEYLYGTESKEFSYVNTVSLSDRYGNQKSASATASIEHVAMSKTMTYNEATAPDAEFGIEVNKDRADLNPDGDTVRIVDESSKSLSIDTKSIRVVSGTTGDPVPFTVDASQMANNIFVVEVPDGQYVKISYRAQVVGVTDQEVNVANNAYFEGHKTEMGESTINKRVIVLNSSGQAESEPMIWFSKKNESAQALGGATYKLEVYNVDKGTDIGTWETVKTDITSTDNDDVKGVQVESLELGKLYRLVETSAPDGYVLDATPHYFVLYKDVAPEIAYPEGVSEEDVFMGPSGSLVTAYDSPYTKVRFAKVSDDNVQLAGAEFAVYSVDSEGAASDTPALDKDGNQVVFTSSADSMNEFTIAPGTYKLVETKTPAGYQAADPVTFEVKGDAQRTVTVNGQTVQYGTGDSINGSLNMVDETRTTSLEVTKTWDDCSNFDGIRPKSATVQLVADGELVDGKTIELNVGNNWTASFDDLAVMKNGKKVEYSVKELNPMDGTPAESGETLSNCYKVTISVTTGDVISGKDEKYSVGVTNSYTPTSTKVLVTKAWDDANNQDGVRPMSIKVQLFADGVAMAGKTATLNAVGQWFASFENLTAAHADGSAVVYSVKEIDPKTGNPVDYGSTLSNGYTVKLISSSYAGYPEGKNPTGIVTAAYPKDEIRRVSYSLTNSRATDTTSIEVEKKWAGPVAESVGVKLQSSEDGKEWTDVKDASATLTKDVNWSHTFSDLPVYAVGRQGVKLTYRVVEDALENYETTYLVGGKASDGTVTPVAGKTEKVTIVNTNTEKVAISGTKVWDDVSNQDGKRPESVTVRLLADGEEVASKELTAADATEDDANAWLFTFGELLKYDATDGHEIAYTVTEDAVTNYTSKIEGNVADSFTVTNSYTPEVTSIEVEKKWVGPAAESVTVKLQSSEDGKEWADVKEASAVLSEEAGWSHTFGDLPVYAPGKQGVKLTYRVVEDAIEDYETAYLVGGKESDGTVTPVAGQTEKVTVANTNKQKVSVSVTKVWDDASNQDGVRPESIKVRLYADGEEIDSKELTVDDASEDDANTWLFTFEDLARHDDEDGHEIAYSVAEDAVDGYESKVEGSLTAGYTVTNSYTPEVTSIEVNKKWVGPAAESATVKLQSSEDGEEWADVEGASATLTKDVNWSHIFENLPVYAPSKQGVKLTYRVVEDKLENYETTYLVDGKDSDGTVTPVAGQTEKITVVNTNTEKVAISGTKVWDDASNRDGKRPESITVRLLADGEEVDSKELTADDATEDNSDVWSFSFEGLAKYDTTDSHEIVYTLTEDTVEGYTSKVEGDVADGFVVTNTKNEEKTPSEPQDKKTDKPKTEKPLPQTGDSSSMAQFVSVIALLLLVPGLVLRRRQ